MAHVKRIATFKAKDSSGRIYVIDVFQQFVDAGTFDNPDATIPGIKSLKTRDGQHVNYVAKGQYHLVVPALDLTSDDPNAT